MSQNYAKLWAQKRLNQAAIQRANEAPTVPVIPDPFTTSVLEP